jgi:UDP:flavonoid glycosyltransferase YjiC (YdhE family)
MRLLVTSVPGLGHLHPVLPLALAAAGAGHDVRVATGPDRVEWVRRCGLRPVPAGLTIAAMREQAVTRNLTGPELPRHMFTSIAGPPMVDALLPLVDDWQPDLLLHEEGEYGAPLVAALRDLPCVTHSWSAPARPAEGRALLDGPLCELWRQYGLADSPRQVGALYLDACPPLLQLPDLTHLGTRVVRVHPSGFDGPPQAAPDWLASLPRPAVYVTLGTEPAFSRPELLQQLVDAVAASAPGVVVTTGPHPPDTVTAPHAGVHIVQYLPQSLVLPAVDAVVAHGGAGTTVGALLHGHPQLVVPGPAPSQQASAARVAAAGVGLRRDWADVTSAHLQEAVQELLTRADLRRSAQDVRNALTTLPRSGEVVALLERETQRRSSAQ